MDKYFNLYREMISLCGLSDHTLKSYCTYIRSYLDYLLNVLHKQPENISWQELREYIIWIQQELNLAVRTINCVISQLRFFTIYVLHKPWDYTQLPKRRFNTYLPFVPNQEETFEFINTIPDIKQKAMVAVMYSSGLRIGEVCHLRYEDIDHTHMRVHILHSKNKQERYAILSNYALDILTKYWFECSRPMGWPRHLTCHSFRHALGTHLYENGTDLFTIKAILGHKSLESTTIYVHLASSVISKVVNPLDRMGGISHE